VNSPARIRVWDLPVRVFHWTLAVLAVFSFTTGKIGAGWLEWHMKSGYAILALLLFRILWGVVGSETARFTHFVRGPRAALDHVRGLLARRPPAGFGHNPLGGWMVLTMLALFLAQAVTGLFVDDEIATQGPLAGKVANAAVVRLTAIHHYNQWLLAAAVGLHLAAIVFYRVRLGTDLAGPMLSGWKIVPTDTHTRQPHGASSVLALVLFALVSSSVYWLVAVYPGN
jgi:cytochrome b